MEDITLTIILRFLLFSFAAFICLSPAVYATEDVTQFESMPSPVFYPFHARVGTRVTILNEDARMRDFREIPACNRADISCDSLDAGQTPMVTRECKVNGKWESVPEVATGSCFFKSFRICYGNPPFECHAVLSAAPSANVVYDSASLRAVNCLGTDNLAYPPEKNYCVFNYVGPSGLSGDTADDMFEIDEDAGAFFVYRNASANAYYIRRDGGRPSQKVMMPSGPAGTFADFKRFIKNPPPFITVERACPPVEITLCSSLRDALPPPPAVDARCGSAHGGTYADFAAIPRSDLCRFGDYREVGNAPADQIRWDCVPPAVVGGGATAQCRAAPEIVPGRDYRVTCTSKAGRTQTVQGRAGDRVVVARAPSNQSTWVIFKDGPYLNCFDERFFPVIDFENKEACRRHGRTGFGGGNYLARCSFEEQ